MGRRDNARIEAERIRDNGGPKSDDNYNYNKIESPGKKILEDPRVAVAACSLVTMMRLLFRKIWTR